MKEYEVVSMGVVYRRIGAEIEFLLLRRVPADGGFWQAVTGHIEEGEHPRDAAIREVEEEAGILLDDLLHVSEDIVHEQEWGDDAMSGRDVVYAFEAPAHIEAVLSKDEHDAHDWLTLDAALERLKYEGNKESLRQVHSYALGRGAQG